MEVVAAVETGASWEDVSESGRIFFTCSTTISGTWSPAKEPSSETESHTDWYIFDKENKEFLALVAQAEE